MSIYQHDAAIQGFIRMENTRYIHCLVLFVFTAFLIHTDGLCGTKATSAILPIKATIVQCGHREKILERCNQDTRCCIFVPPVKANNHAEQRNIGEVEIQTAAEQTDKR